MEAILSIDDILFHLDVSLGKSASYNDITPLRNLVAQLRPSQAHDVASATANLRSFCFVLQQQAQWRSSLRSYLIQVLSSRKLVHLLTDTGITYNASFWDAWWQRVTIKFLPPLINDNYLKDVFGQIFDHGDDHIWVGGIADEMWLELLRTIGLRLSLIHI
jgi:site-specific recombinase